MKKHQLIVKILSYAFLSVTSFIMVYPLLFMLLGAFTTNDRFLDTILLPIPNTLSYFVQGMVASGLKG